MRSWARLNRKMYEVDPLTCLKCQGAMRVIPFIEDQDVIKRILKRLGLWGVKLRHPPRMAKSQTLFNEPRIDYSESQEPITSRTSSIRR